MRGKCSHLFVCALACRERLLAIICCAQVTVNNNPTQHRSDSRSDEGGGRENRTSLLQIDSVAFQFPRFVLWRL